MNGTAREAISVMDKSPSSANGAFTDSKVEMDGSYASQPPASTETDVISSIGETQQASLMPSTYTFDAAFTFGLVTTDKNPSCEKYLASTAKFVRSIVSETLAFETPILRSIQKDGTCSVSLPICRRLACPIFHIHSHYLALSILFVPESFMDPAGRAYVYRYLVVVSVPFVASNEAMGQDTRNAVVDGVSQSIQYGTFGF
jgi:hypothetical protein